MTNVFDQVITERYAAYHGDCIEIMRGLPSDSIGYSIFSPPFSNLYCYSNSERDAGNCRDDAEFHEAFRFVLRELYRVMMPGRDVSIHCMDLPSLKQNHGFIGLRDFRGDLVRAAQEEGFIYHSNVTIWKDPVVAMQRTKAIGLLYKQLKKDSALSRQGIPDYLVTLRKRGDNPHPITHTPADLPVDEWQRLASPVWMDINPSDTLQKESARDEKDERHICPLQLEVIRRGIKLWSNHGDIVLSPFGGIGSESYVALQEGRRAVTCELKDSYFKQLVQNLAAAVTMGKQGSLFAMAI